MAAGLAITIVVVANLVAVAIMLLARRRAPEGGYYHDTQQAGWVYSVAGTSFAVVLAFVFLLAFQSFDRARTDSSAEAQAAASLFHTAELFPPAIASDLRGQLVCYARGVIALEWPAMRSNRASPIVAARVRSIERAFARAPGVSSDARSGAAYGAWFDQMQQRQDGRQGRLDQAGRFVPPIVWFFLLLGGVLVIGFVWLFADRSERAFAQAALPIGVTTIVVSGLVLVAFFDKPYNSTAGVTPTSMERALRSMVAERGSVGGLPCDADGRPV